MVERLLKDGAPCDHYWTIFRCYTKERWPKHGIESDRERYCGYPAVKPEASSEWSCSFRGPFCNASKSLTGPVEKVRVKMLDNGPIYGNAA